MNRRGFFQGMFGGLTAAGLIVTAKPKELEAFAAPLVKDEPLIIAPPTVPEIPTDYLYNKAGEQVAMITSLSVTSIPNYEEVDVTSFGESYKSTFIGGLRDTHFSIEAVAIGPVQYRPGTGITRLKRPRR